MTTFGTLTQKGEVINKIKVDLNNVPSTDPIAFMFGVKSGQDRIHYEQELKHYRDPIKHGSLHSELAQEYLRGFLYGFKGILIPEGTKIKKGQEQSYALLDFKINKL